MSEGTENIQEGQSVPVVGEVRADDPATTKPVVDPLAPTPEAPFGYRRDAEGNIVPRKKWGRPKESKNLVKTRKQKAIENFMLDAIRETVPPAILNDLGHTIIKFPPSNPRRIDLGGHWEKWLGKKWWVKEGELVDETIKRLKGCTVQEKNILLKRINAEREERRYLAERELEESTNPPPQAEQIELNEEGEQVFPDTELPLPKGYRVEVHNTNDKGQPMKRTPQQVLVKFLWDKRHELNAKLWEVAMGVTVEKIVRGGKKVIYTQAPNEEILLYLADQFYGKPKTREKTLAEAVEKMAPKMSFKVSDVK